MDELEEYLRALDSKQSKAVQAKPTKAVQPEAPAPRTVVIPMSERPISTFFVDKPVQTVDEDTLGRNFSAWIQAWLTKHPHYEYLYATKCSWSGNKLQLWFQNTDTKVKTVVSKKELLEVINDKNSRRIRCVESTRQLDVRYKK